MLTLAIGKVGIPSKVRQRQNNLGGQRKLWLNILQIENFAKFQKIPAKKWH
jgi:hypothetical protein